MSEREAILGIIGRAVCVPKAGAQGVTNALAQAGYVIVKREADTHQIDAAYAQCGMDGPDLALMYRVMVEAAQEQK